MYNKMWVHDMKNIYRYIFLALFLFFIGTYNTYAFDVDTEFYNRPKNKVLNSKIYGGSDAVPAEYSFSIGEKGSTARVDLPAGVEWFETDGHDNLIKADEQYKKYINGNYSVTRRNVGVYDGRIIDVKATVLDYNISKFDSDQGSQIAFGLKTNGLGVDAFARIRDVKVKFEFSYSDNNKPAYIKGNTTYWDVDAYQGIGFDDSSNKGIFLPKNFADKSYLYTNNSNYIYEYHTLNYNPGLEHLHFGDPGNYTDCQDTKDKLTDLKSCTGAFAFTEIFEGYSITRTFTFGYKEGAIIANSNGTIALSRDAVVSIPKYGYSMDMACSNCTEDFSANVNEKRVYVFQDTFDWDAIKASDTVSEGSNSTACKNLNNHFKQPGSNIYCREEYYVSLPNKSDADNIEIKNFRYFTLNELASVPGIKSISPVKVKKIRECKGSNLEQFNKKNSLVGTDIGKLYIDYDEGEVYNFANVELVPKINEKESSSKIKGDLLTQTVVYDYNLPDNFYRYTGHDGKVIKTKTEELFGRGDIRDLKVSTLPISNDSKKVSIAFKYKLPKRMREYGSDNKGLNCATTAESNIYEGIASENLKNTACYKLYINGEKENTRDNCVDYRQGHKEAFCTIKDGYLTRTNSDSYKCSFGDNDDGGGSLKCNKDTYEKYERDWNEKEGKCCDEGEKYYDSIGKCILSTDGDCEIKDGEYYYKKKNVTKEDYDKYCCPDGKIKCVDTCIDEGEICPTGGDINNIVYRVIGLDNPFVGQEGLSRNTGINWCSYMKDKDDYSCSYNNPLVKKIITNKESSDDFLYRITLDGKTIKEIREYNKDHIYDDWDLSCKDGEACISEFLDKYVSVGKCSNNLSDNFYTCNK